MKLHRGAGEHGYNPLLSFHIADLCSRQCASKAEERFLKDILIRFLIGGLVVSAFAAMGDMFKPKSFAGLFGAAPSVALATLGLTIVSQGKLYAATEARSMIAGALAFCLYALCVSYVMMRFNSRALPVTIALVPVWFAVALALGIAGI
jgi:hypothetical protein